MTICLTMIVKNEAHCITRCLESVKPYIDYWVICDTGSIDFTEQMVKEALKGIPGEFHKHEWKDFATNRNLAVQIAKEKADYTLMMDADDYLVVNDESTFDKLIGPVYNIRLFLANIAYSRPQLIHHSVDYKYRGVLHEYVELPPGTSSSILPGCIIRCGSNGARSRNPEKYLKDAQLLEKAVADNPSDPRNYFYCAQSYRDAGRFEEAINFYLRRAEMEGGFAEERFCSYFEVGKMLERIRPTDFSSITTNYLKAYQCNPNRAESLTYLAIYYRRRDLLPGAYIVAKEGASIAKPVDALFLEPECYDWQIQDELAVAGYHMGKFQEAMEINQKLLAGGMLPTREIPRIVANLDFCKKKLGLA